MLKKILLILILIFLWSSQSFALNNNSINKIEKNSLLVVWDLTKSSFTIDTSNVVPWWNKLIVKWSVKKTVNNVLWTIIQKLMIAIWVISLLVMTIWAWYMIFYHWQDELLSKGKSIFNSGIIALIVALSSYYIVSLVRLILYSNS